MAGGFIWHGQGFLLTHRANCETMTLITNALVLIVMVSAFIAGDAIDSAIRWTITPAPKACFSTTATQIPFIKYWISSCSDWRHCGPEGENNDLGYTCTNHPVR